ncbi:hypothetical protein C3747_127g100 [Trypanosoma cruzi]|uniref:Uncharacterized protein n=1 Tax=Trypanosoma cruzi TaxID=5693 RepID=A0A2V2WAL4_TRYCR|nr:hypothetical protein C3747_127g100 [Trypanosoma cruzi]
MKKKGSKGGDASPAIAVPFISPFSRNRRIEINSVVICEICVILTYDRRVRPPEDVLFRGSPIGTFVPSLHRATIRLPTVRFRDVSRKTLMEVCNTVQEVLFFEFLKQIPSFIFKCCPLPDAFSTRQYFVARRVIYLWLWRRFFRVAGRGTHLTEKKRRGE